MSAALITVCSNYIHSNHSPDLVNILFLLFLPARTAIDCHARELFGTDATARATDATRPAFDFCVVNLHK